MTGAFILKRPPDQLANTTDIGKVEIAIRLTRGANADKRELRLVDGVVLIVCCPEPPDADGLGENFTDFGFDDGGFTGVYQIDFRAEGIYANDFVPFTRQATGGNCTNVTQTEDANFQSKLPAGPPASALDVLLNRTKVAAFKSMHRSPRGHQTESPDGSK